MIINGVRADYVCKQCRRDLLSEDITYYGMNAEVINTNCCKVKPVKKNWLDKLREKWKR